MKAKLSLLVVSALALAVLLAPAATAAPAKPNSLAACGTRVDIGVTVFSGGYVKGSGSYTTQSCLAIASVSLVIMRTLSYDQNRWEEASWTKVTRYPPEPSSAKFSPRDYACGLAKYRSFKTKIKWTYSGGGGGYKYSNTIHVICF
jgi:hypothetical protein